MKRKTKTKESHIYYVRKYSKRKRHIYRVFFTSPVHYYKLNCINLIERTMRSSKYDG